jgi:hypothetical protein
MSNTPATTAICSDARWRTGRTPTTSATAMRNGTDASRATSSGHMPESDDVRSRQTNNMPKHPPTPTASATMRGGVLCWCGPMAPLTSATAATAHTMPTSASSDGRSPSAMPTTTGTAAPTTALTGATTVMSPCAKP